MRQPNNRIANSIIKSLCYSDIFDYPLTRDEIINFYIGRKTPSQKINQAIDELLQRGIISSTNNLFFLKGRGILSKIRKQRSIISKKKWNIAKGASALLSKIPTVKFIGVSGSLSMNNAAMRDDIDLFIITSKNTLWMSRFLVNIVLIAAGLKRNRTDSAGVDLVCPNMFLAESNLTLQKSLYTAHEIAQLQVLVNKDNTYEEFIERNKWVLSLMPNAVKIPNADMRRKVHRGFALIDRVFYFGQYFYMKRRMTNERVSTNTAFFHPRDTKKFVEILFAQKYKMSKKFMNLTKTAQPREVKNLASNRTLGY